MTGEAGWNPATILEDRDTCERHETAVAHLGQVAAAELETVIADFNAAETAAKFISLRPDRFVADGPNGLVMTLRCGVRLRFVSGHPIKRVVSDQVQAWLSDPALIAQAEPSTSIEQRNTLLRDVAELASQWSSLVGSEQRRIITALVGRIDIGQDSVDVHLLPDQLGRAV